MSADPALLRAARDTYNLEVVLNDGLSSDALEKAIDAALGVHEQAVLQRVAGVLEAFATGMETDQSQTDDYVLALRWAAHKVRDDLGQPELPYEPKDDDVVEVVVVGSVFLHEGACAACHHTPEDSFTWSVIDDKTGDQFQFRTQPGRMPRVRVLSTSEKGK